MLVKTLELVIIILFISLIFFQAVRLSETIYIYYKHNYELLERFLKGRFWIKFLTESEIFSNSICNLNQNFSYFIEGKLDLSNIINNTELLKNLKIEVFDLETKNKLFEFGENFAEYFSFSRICYYNGRLIKVSVLV